MMTNADLQVSAYLALCKKMVAFVQQHEAALWQAWEAVPEEHRTALWPPDHFTGRKQPVDGEARL